MNVSWTIITHGRFFWEIKNFWFFWSLSELNPSFSKNVNFFTVGSYWMLLIGRAHPSPHIVLNENSRPKGLWIKVGGLVMTTWCSANLTYFKLKVVIKQNIFNLNTYFWRCLYTHSTVPRLNKSRNHLLRSYILALLIKDNAWYQANEKPFIKPNSLATIGTSTNISNLYK